MYPFKKYDLSMNNRADIQFTLGFTNICLSFIHEKFKCQDKLWQLSLN
jgi:hypothetical protein